MSESDTKKDKTPKEKKEKKEKGEKKEKKEKMDKEDKKDKKDKKDKEDKKDKKAKKDEKKDKKDKKDKQDKENAEPSTPSKPSVPFPESIFGDLPDITEEGFMAKLGEGVKETPLAEGNSYFGEWDHGQPSGIGKITFARGDKYVGQLSVCRPDGIGIYTKSDGSSQTGSYTQGKLHGYGIHRNTEGFLEYKGGYIDDKRTGVGMECDSKDRFEGIYIGEFQNNIKQGRGRSIISHNHSCVGLYDNNVLVYGIYRFPSGSQYHGEFQLGQPHGFGKMIYASGRIYVGKFVDGASQGEGAMFGDEGQLEYCGFWRQGKKHGRGFHLQPGNQYREGQWIDDNKTRWHSDPVDASAYDSKIKMEDFQFKDDFVFAPWKEDYEQDLLRWMEEDFKLIHESISPSGHVTGLLH